MKPGEKLATENEKFVLEFLLNEEIIVLRIGRVVLWDTAKFGRGNRFSMQNDGRAVLYDKNNKEIFATSNGGKYIMIENNGELVVRDDSSTTIWSTKTTHSKFISNLYNF